MADDDSWVTLELDEAGADPERLEEDLRYLLDEVAQLPGTEVHRPDAGPAPPGTRGSAGIELATAVVALGGSGAALPMLVGLVRDWLGRRASGSVRLKIGSDEIELSHASDSLQRQALAEFVDRHRS